MACIEKIYSVSALVGGAGCNGNCSFCAGKYLRSEALPNNPIYWKNFESAIRLSARYGGWSLSLTGSGEPSLYPDEITKALEIYSKCARDGAYFPNVNLFTNGISFGDTDYCDVYLPRWKKLGLTNIAISVHSVDNQRQAEAYGLDGKIEKNGKPAYPFFWTLKENIEKHGIGVRATVLLRKGEIDNYKSYREAVEFLVKMCKIDNITSWPVGNPDGTSNEFTPSFWGLASIRWWLRRNAKLCHGHAWGGGVYDWNGAILRLTDYVTRHDPKKDFVRQLVVFQDGTVAYSWIREGALCMK